MFSFTSASALECDNAITQFEMNQCAEETYVQTEYALEKMYHDVRHHTNGEQRQLLETAQQRWQQFRDAECTFRNYAVQQGSIAPMARALCLTDANVERTTALKHLLHCQDCASLAE